ncbi:MAG: hypothetical protein AAF907_12250, partial [Planctomycetota bacterium]
LKIAERFAFETLRETLADAKSHSDAKTCNVRSNAVGYAELQLLILRHGGEATVRRTLAERDYDYRLLSETVRVASGMPGVGLAVRAALKFARGGVVR